MPDKTVLIVDADNSSLNYLAHMLQEQNYSVLRAGTGKEGLIYAWRDQPDLIIFDPALQDVPPLGFLGKLRRDSRSINIPILALSSDPDPKQRDACLQAGCTEYLVKSGEAVSALPDVIAGLLGEKPDDDKTGGYLFVFLSAKGGTGTSSLCANLAMAVKHHQPEVRVAVADLVLPIGSIAHIVGYEGDIDLVSVAELPRAKMTKEYFHKNLPNLAKWRFQLLPGTTTPGRANQLQVARIPEIIKGLRAAYDYVLVDLGRSLSRISLPVIQQADLLVVTMSSDLSTVRLTKQIWTYLQELGVESKKIYTIMNRAVGLEGLTRTETEEMLGLPIKASLPYMSGNFALANNQHVPILVKYPRESAALAVRDSAKEMINIVSQTRIK